MIFIALLDIFLLSIIVLWSADELRQLHATSSPLRSALFYVLAITAFGWIAHIVQTHVVTWWALTLHTIVATVAIFAFGTHPPHGSPRHELDRHSSRRPV